jgi:hypothetical protein
MAVSVNGAAGTNPALQSLLDKSAATRQNARSNLNTINNGGMNSPAYVVDVNGLEPGGRGASGKAEEAEAARKALEAQNTQTTQTTETTTNQTQQTETAGQAGQAQAPAASELDTLLAKSAQTRQQAGMNLAAINSGKYETEDFSVDISGYRDAAAAQKNGGAQSAETEAAEGNQSKETTEADLMKRIEEMYNDSQNAMKSLFNQQFSGLPSMMNFLQ